MRSSFGFSFTAGCSRRQAAAAAALFGHSAPCAHSSSFGAAYSLPRSSAANAANAAARLFGSSPSANVPASDASAPSSSSSARPSFAARARLPTAAQLSSFEKEWRKTFSPAASASAALKTAGVAAFATTSAASLSSSSSSSAGMNAFFAASGATANPAGANSPFNASASSSAPASQSSAGIASATSSSSSTGAKSMSTAAGATSGVAASGEGEADDADSRKRQSQSSSSSDSLAANRPIVGYWYLFSSALVFGIVVLGGLTRLTESGLSIVEWNVIKGMKPPRSQQEWEDEFNKYKQFPEYKLLNHNITLDEFKFIFYMEWAHRMLGRFIGLSFVIPGAYFAYKGFMTPSIQKRSLVVATLIGGQGVLGWFMVKSGLSDELLEKPFATPRVSHYWLTAHLTSAFVIYSIMFYTGVSIVRATWTRNAAAAFKPLVSDALKSLRSFRKYTHYTAGLIFLTAMSGALVAGLDAGLIYNEFPYMGNGIIPEDFWSLSTLTDRNPQPISAFRNVLENPVAVQFNHRLLACTTFTVISALWVYSRRLPLPGASRIAANAVMAVAVAQVTLGISTLLYLVPVPLAAAHQAGSLTLLTTSLWLMHTLRVIPK